MWSGEDCRPFNLDLIAYYNRKNGMEVPAGFYLLGGGGALREGPTQSAKILQGVHREM